MSEPGENREGAAQKIYSVSEISSQMARMFAGDHIFGSTVAIRGELSAVHAQKAENYTNLYFDIKDDGGVISCYRYIRGSATVTTTFGEWFKSGAKVVATGRIEVAQTSKKYFMGKYSFKPVSVRLDGEGEIARRLKELDERLEREGYYAQEHKKPVPHYPSVIGIITAPAGDAIVDIVKHIRDREPAQEMIFYPATVQGANAPASITHAIRVLESYGVDVICLGRGGGGADDLAAFGNEAVAKAIYDCTVPIVTFVGHTADRSIADKVADKAGGTPTAAATMLIPLTAEERLNMIRRESDRMALAMENTILKRGERLSRYETKLTGFAPEERLRNMKDRMQHIRKRLDDRMEQKVRELKEQCERRSDELPGGLERRIVGARHRYELAYQEMVERSPMERPLLKARHRYEKALETMTLRSPMDRRLERARHRYESACDKLEDRNPLKKLRGGFGYVQTADGKSVSSIGQVKRGDRITVRMEKGKILAGVEETSEEGIV